MPHITICLDLQMCSTNSD